MTKRIPTINILRKYTGWKIGPFIFYYLRFTVNFRQHVFKCFNKTVRPRSRTNGSANVRHGLFVDAEGKHNQKSGIQYYHEQLQITRFDDLP